MGSRELKKGMRNEKDGVALKSKHLAELGGGEEAQSAPPRPPRVHRASFEERRRRGGRGAKGGGDEGNEEGGVHEGGYGWGEEAHWLERDL